MNVVRSGRRVNEASRARKGPQVRSDPLASVGRKGRRGLWDRLAIPVRRGRLVLRVRPGLLGWRVRPGQLVLVVQRELPVRPVRLARSETSVRLVRQDLRDQPGPTALLVYPDLPDPLAWKGLLVPPGRLEKLGRWVCQGLRDQLGRPALLVHPGLWDPLAWTVLPARPGRREGLECRDHQALLALSEWTVRQDRPVRLGALVPLDHRGRWGLPEPRVHLVLRASRGPLVRLALPVRRVRRASPG